MIGSSPGPEAGRRTPGPESSTAPESPTTMGLLAYLNAHALDEDYATSSVRTTARPRAAAPWAVLAVAAFVLLLITAATQASSNTASDQRERADLIHQLENRKASANQGAERVERLHNEVGRLRARLVNNEKLSTGMRDQLSLLSVRGGTVPVEGPGVEIAVDDAPNAESDRSKVLDTDLQQLVNGLWQAGAEAVSVNGQRLTSLSAIMGAGIAITVNFTSLERPYVVRAVGDPATLPARFGATDGGQAWLDLHQQVGLQFNIRTSPSMSLPAARLPVLNYAVPQKGSKTVEEGSS